MFGWLKKKNVHCRRKTRPVNTRATNQKPAVFSGTERNANPGESTSHTEPLAADLVVTYAFDRPGMFQMASVAGIADLGISPEEIRGIALANLKRQLPQIGVDDSGLVRRIVTGENLEACTLLATQFWDNIAAETEGEVVVAVPSRDVVLFTSSQSVDGISALLQLSAEVLQEETTHGLTDRLLVWRGGQWNEFHS